MGIIIGILCLAALIIIHELGHFLVARLFGMRVVRFSVGFLKPLVEWKPRGSETTYSIGVLPLGGYVQIDGLSPIDEVDPDDRKNYVNQPWYAKFAMIIAGPLANFLAAVLLFALLFALGMPKPIDEPVIGSLDEGNVAQKAGLQPHDRLLSIGGNKVESWDDMAQTIQKNKGKSITLEFQRNEKVLELTLTPHPETGYIGIRPARILDEPLNMFESFGKGFTLAGLTTLGMGYGIYRILTGQKTSAGVAGPVGIVQLIVDATREGWRSLSWLIAQQSLSLCLFNFLPVPALDGGRITFLLVEAITRRRVNRTIEGYIHAAGLVFVLGLLLLVTLRDFVGLM